MKHDREAVQRRKYDKIKIDVTMVKEFIPNYDPNIKESPGRLANRKVQVIKKSHLQRLPTRKAENPNNEMEMVMDEETGCLQPIANNQQRTILICTHARSEAGR